MTAGDPCVYIFAECTYACTYKTAHVIWLRWRIMLRGQASYTHVQVHKPAIARIWLLTVTACWAAAGRVSSSWRRPEMSGHVNRLGVASDVVGGGGGMAYGGGTFPHHWPAQFCFTRIAVQ